MDSSITYTTAQELQELIQIQSLQSKHHKDVIPKNLWGQKGYVTLRYSLEMLQKAGLDYPPIVAKFEGDIIGYLLIFDQKILGMHPVIDHFIYQINPIKFRGEPLESLNYVMVGQLCVDHNFSGKGIAKGMYAYFKKFYASSFSYCVTDIDKRNLRSLKLHYGLGFQLIGKSNTEEAEWNIVLWDWNS